MAQSVLNSLHLHHRFKSAIFVLKTVAKKSCKKSCVWRSDDRRQEDGNGGLKLTKFVSQKECSGQFLTLIHEHERKERSLSVTNGIMKSCLKYHYVAIITKCEIIRHLFKG